MLTQIQTQISGCFVTKMKLEKPLTVTYPFFFTFAYSSDPAMSFKMLSRALVPELAAEQQLVTVSSSALPLPKDCDLDTESTVL